MEKVRINNLDITSFTRHFMKVFKIKGCTLGGALTLKCGIDVSGSEEPFHASSTVPLFFKPQLQQHSVI